MNNQKPEKKIYYDLSTQYENTGDLLINKAAVEVIRKKYNLIIDDTKAPRWFVECILAPSDKLLSRISNKSAVKEVIFDLVLQKLNVRKKAESYLVLVPGHISGAGVKTNIAKLKRLIALSVIRLLGGKVVKFGVSIGPFDKLGSFIESLISRTYHYYGLRDQDSLNLAKKLNFKNTKFFPDLAWSYEARNAIKTDERKNIVFSFRSNSYGVSHQDEYLKKVINCLKEIVLDVKFQNNKILIAYQVSYDRPASVEIYEQLKKVASVELIDRKLSLDDAIALYHTAEMVVTNRLHVLLLAAQCDALPIALIKQNDNKKIIGIFGDNNLAQLLIDSDTLAPDAVSRKIAEVCADKQQYMQTIQVVSAKHTMYMETELDTIFEDSISTKLN